MIRISPRFLGVLLLLVAAVAARASEPADPGVELRWKLGDNPRWADPAWDDRDWSRLEYHCSAKMTGHELPGRTGIYWLRFRLDRSQPPSQPEAELFVWPRDRPGAPIDGAFIAAVFSFEFYWDGHLIGRSGVVGNDRASEVAGPLDHLFRIPDELRGPGPHVIALRMSSYHYNFSSSSFWPYFAMVNYTRRLVFETRQPLVPLMGAAGALLVTAVCAVLYWLVDRRRSVLLLGLFSLAVVIFYVLIAWRWLHNDPYPWLSIRYTLITGLMTVISVLAPALLLEQFGVPGRSRWLLVLVPFLAAAWLVPEYHWDKAFWMCAAMYGFSLLVASWAAWRKRPGAWIVLIGLLVGLSGMRNSDRGIMAPSFFISFASFVLFLLFVVGREVQADRRRAQEAMLTKARLETELLKKNIQPHFLMNTLTTIMEVIEEDPKGAVTLVDALAGEFRILARVSGEKLIPLEQELELCRAHLQIMSLRRGVECTLEVRNADETSPLPPALFHTLVEGGLTHQGPRNGRLRFVLDASYLPGLARYTLTVYGKNPPTRGPVRDGTGLRYVKARLEESFMGRWSLAAGPVTEGWQTVIEIQRPPGESGSW